MADLRSPLPGRTSPAAGQHTGDEGGGTERRETVLERWDRNFTELLQELRVAQTGVQILFAFLLTLPFTSRFAESKDLRAWKLLPEECVFTKERYSACPSIRHFDGWFYMAYLETRPGPRYETHVVRSKDYQAAIAGLRA